MTDTKRLRRIGEAVGIELGRDSGEIIKAAAAEMDAQAEEIKILRKALTLIEQTGGDATSGDGHARCKQIARAALQGESHE